MKITDIECFPVWLGHRNYLIVKVITDDDLYGIGEAGFSGREQAVMGVIRHYTEFLRGRDPMRIGALWQEMYRSCYFEGGRTLTAAISAIDIALHDIKGKALGVPVYELLGGRHRDMIPAFVTTGLPVDQESRERLDAVCGQGWKVIRFGAPRGYGAKSQMNQGWQETTYDPRESIAAAAEGLIKAREILGGRYVLGLDFHHRLSVAETASLCQRMPSGTIDFLEEPIRDECPAAYAALRTMTDVPLAIGEEMSSKWQFLPYIEQGLTNYARVDLCNVGGFTEAMKVAGWAEAHYIDMMPHDPLSPVCTAASLHLLAAVPNVAWLETRVPEYHGSEREQYEAELFPDAPRLDGTTFPTPEKPGLGITFNEEAVRETEFRYWESPHLRRPDGSFTNW